MTKRMTTAWMASACAAVFCVGAVALTAAQQPAAQGQGAAAQAGRAGGAPAAAGFGGGRGGPQNQVARVEDVMQMLSALPDRAPATPRTPARRVLVFGRAGGFVHSSIPLATRTVEALGQKTGAFTTVISFNPTDINAENLAGYDAVFLASTTGSFLDDPNDATVTAARRKALLDFVRSGKGLAGVHAATDSYHGGGARGAAPAGAAPGGAAAGGAAGRGAAGAAGAGAPGAGAAAAPAAAGGRGQAGPLADPCNFAPGSTAGTSTGGAPLWPEFNTMVGGYFKWHWNYPTQVYLKIDDPTSPLNAPFMNNGQPRSIAVLDEIYTLNELSWSRERSHVLTSIDYAKMPACVRAQEPAPQRSDRDYPLSYIQKEGNGRMFMLVLGHDEGIYKMRPILEHMLAGLQYAVGDLVADDSPSVKK